MKPCERKRASSRWATRCSRWRWTVSSVITPSSSKTTGRTLASRRHSVSFWSAGRGARSVSSVAAQLGSVPVRRSSAGKLQRPSAPGARGGAPSSSSEQDSASRNGAGSNPVHARERSSSVRQRSICPRRSSWRSRAVVELLGDDALALRVEIRPVDLAGEPLDVGVADALAQAALDVVVDHPREAAELALDRVGLADEHLEHAVLGALGQHEVVAADLRGRLELAVDPPVALLDPPGVPRQVEVEEVGAVGLEVEPLAGGVGGDQDPQRVVGRVRC